MRKETFDRLKKLMTSEEKEAAEAFYEQRQDGSLERTTDRKEDLEQLNGLFRLPMAMLSGMEEAAPELEAQDITLSDEQILTLREQVSARAGDMSESMLDQRAVLFVKQE